MRHAFVHERRSLSYLDARAPVPGGRGTLLLLHAFPLAAAMWEPQLTAPPAGWRVVAPDLRGFGGSDPDLRPQPAGSDATALSIGDYARDALALLDHLEIADAVVCGLSMGGYAALAMLGLAAGRVRGLVLADTRGDADTDAARDARGRMLETLATGGVRAVADGMLPRLLGQTSQAKRPAIVERVKRLAGSQGAEGVGAAILRMRDRPDSTLTLRAIRCPALVIAGAEDEITGPDVAQALHESIPGSSLVILDGAGHLSNLEQPEAFNETLGHFLTGLPSTNQ